MHLEDKILNGLKTVQPRVNSHSRSKRAYWGSVLMLFVLAAGLRFSLALVNRQANDNHLEVIQLMLQGKEDLTHSDCHECFHPKFFYGCCAAVFTALQLENEDQQIVCGQLINATSGMLVLACVWGVLQQVSAPPALRLVALGLLATNPRLVAINAQLSNDSFAVSVR